MSVSKLSRVNLVINFIYLFIYLPDELIHFRNTILLNADGRFAFCRCAIIRGTAQRHPLPYKFGLVNAQD